MLTAVRMVPARAWNCSLKRARMQFQAMGINRRARPDVA
jgi:hypothetical protein